MRVCHLQLSIDASIMPDMVLLCRPVVDMLQPAVPQLRLTSADYEVGFRHQLHPMCQDLMVHGELSLFT